MKNLGKWKHGLCAALFVALFLSQSAIAIPTLSVVATPNSVYTSTPVGADILVNNALDLYAFQFTLSFDPAILQATGVGEGTFLSGGGATFFDGGTVDNVLGSISFIFDVLVGPLTGVSGNGVLAHIDFNTIDIGASRLDLTDVQLLDSNFNVLETQVQNGSVNAVPEPGSLGLFLVACVAGVARRIGAGPTATKPKPIG